MQRDPITQSLLPHQRRDMLLPVLLPLFHIGLAVGQYDQPYPVTTPVPILKQINKHNEDGSYSYGYEAADGSYKIESKYPTGEVYGKYGFVDDTGSVREVEYGASRRGFEPAGPGINVPPPTLTGNSINSAREPEDDGQYREDPAVYYTDPRFTNGERYEPTARQPLAYNQQPPVVRPMYQPPPRYPTVAPYREPTMIAPQYQPEYRPQYRAQYQPEYQGQQRSAYPASAIQSGYQGHQAPSADPNAGLASYTINYKR